MSVVTYAQLQEIFANLTASVLGLSLTDGSVRTTWPQTGAPGWNITDDVAFVMVNFDDDQISRQREIVYSQYDANNANATLSYNAVVRATWRIYGPNAFDNAWLLNDSLYQPSSKAIFDANGLGIIPDIPMPVFAPELFNSQWWPASSTYARFNTLVERTSQIPYITSAPITTQQG